MMIRFAILLLANWGMFSLLATAQSFETRQKTNTRVREAFENQEKEMSALLRSKGIRPDRFRLLFQVFKAEQEFEVWASATDTGKFVHLVAYPICAPSGVLGPKRKQGDKQVPEGFYEIDYFKPESWFHMALHVSYPNASDRILGKGADLGGDIMIHGACVTIGCIPLTDPVIEKVYVLGVRAKSSGQSRIPVYLFPFRMEKERVEKELRIKSQSHHKPFWHNIREGYVHFRDHRQLIRYQVGKDGLYIFQNQGVPVSTPDSTR